MTHATAYYRLKRGCSDEVKDLLNKKVYIYPVKGSKACNTVTAANCLCPDSDVFSQRQQNKPYGNGVFQAILTDTIFKGDDSIADKLREMFCSSLAALEDELEIPEPMMAFIATGVYPSLALIDPLLISTTGTSRHSGVGKRRTSTKVLHCAFDHSSLSEAHFGP
jgi:hypothetical protein